jgi:hypothetical protein
MKLAFVASLFVLAGVASAQNLSEMKPNLELRLTPGKLLNGVPVEFTFELVNVADHDVYVPKPRVDCVSSLDGYIWLELDFTPAKFNNSGSGFGCIEDQVGFPAILQRTRDWQLLHPGEMVRQSLRKHELHYDDKGAGTYEFWAEYHSPSINSQDQETLRKAGIDFPRQDLKTQLFVYKRR